MVVIFVARTMQERRDPDPDCLVEAERGDSVPSEGYNPRRCASVCPTPSYRGTLQCSRRNGHQGPVHVCKGYSTELLYGRWHD